MLMSILKCIRKYSNIYISLYVYIFIQSLLHLMKHLCHFVHIPINHDHKSNEKICLSYKDKFWNYTIYFRACNNLIKSYTIPAFHLYLILINKTRNISVCHVCDIYLHLPKADLEVAPRYLDRNELGKLVPCGRTDEVACNRAYMATKGDQRMVQRSRNRKQSQIRTSSEIGDSIQPAKKGPLSLPTLLPQNKHSLSCLEKW